MKSPLGTLLNRAPVSYASRGGVSLPPLFRNNAAAQLGTYGSVGTLFSIVHTLAESTAQVNWRLWRKTTDGRRRFEAEETRIEVTRHAALDLWRKPNPFMVQQELVESWQQHEDLVGEGYLVIGRSPLSDIPLELWSVRPDRMTPIPHPTDFLAGYVYTGPNGEQVPLRLDEVICIKYPNPLDPYRGLGPVQSVLVDLDSMRYSAQWNRAFFLNSAEPGGIIEAPAKLSDAEFMEFTDRWREQHQGVSGAHRVAILEGMKWVNRSMTMRDMQFSELRKVSREIIREAFGVHGHILGLSEDINKANAEAADSTFGKRKVRPRLERIKQALNSKLLPMFGSTGDNLEFDFDNPEPPDRESDNAELTAKTAAFATLVNAGVDEDSASEICGLPQVAMREMPAMAPEPETA